MAKRDERLNSLKISSACEASWDAMQGNERRRFCDSCRKDVFDFAQMTPRDIHAHLQASRGHLCARLTHEGGRLRVLPANEPAVPWTPRPARRVSPFAATLVSAWLGMGSAAAQPAAPASAALESSRENVDESLHPQERSLPPSATLRGKVIAKQVAVPGVLLVARDLAQGRDRTAISGADGSFVFENLAAGVYDLSGTAADHDIEMMPFVIVEPGRDRAIDLEAESLRFQWTRTGGISMSTPRLRENFDESTLVVSAVMGLSVVVEVSEEYVEVATELQIDAVIKGDHPGHLVRYRHEDYAESPGQMPSSGVEPGAKVLAFLALRGESGPGGERIYDLTSYVGGILQLESERHAAYLERLEALAAIERDRGARPFELVEWLVATTENPSTRLESVGDLNVALYALEALAEREDAPQEAVANGLRRLLESTPSMAKGAGERPVLLAAGLDTGRKERLTRALVRTETLNEADRYLWKLVRRWDDGVARNWLADRFRKIEPPADDAGDMFWWLQSNAENLGGATGRTLAAEASAQKEALDEEDSETDLDHAERKHLQGVAAVNRALMRELADLIVTRSVSEGGN